MELIDYIESKRDDHLNELKEFLRIPSVSTKSEHKPDIERAARWVAEKLRAAGLEKRRNRSHEDAPACLRRIAARPRASRPFSSMVTTTCSRRSRSICGPLPHSNPPSATAIFSAAARPTTKDRSTSTSRRSRPCERVSGKLPINVKVMIEGEEEVGSVNLWDFVRQNRDAAEGRCARGLRHVHAREGRSLDHIRPARLELLSDRNHGPGAGSSLGSFRWRRSESDHDPCRDDRQAARQEFPRADSGLLRSMSSHFRARSARR